MKKLVTFLILIQTLTCFSQKIEWAATAPFASFVSHPNFIVNDKFKNSFILGEGRYVGNGIFFIKYDSQGNKVWEKNYKSEGSVVSMAVDTLGFVYITIGVHRLTIDGIEYVSDGRVCLFIKYDQSGNIIWLKKYGHGLALSEKTDSENNLTVTGTVGDTVYLENNNVLYPVYPQWNHYIAKYNTNGECLTSSQVVGGCYPLLTTKDKSKYTNSWFSGNSITLGKTNKLTLLKENGAGYCAKYNNNDELVWVKQTDAWCLASDEFGNAYALEQDGNKVYINKYGSVGNLLWKRTPISVGGIYKAQMKCDSYGNLFYTGGFKDYMTIGDTTISANGNTRAFVAKFDSTGKLRWITTSAGSGGAGVKDLTIKGNEIYITGDLGGENTFGEFTLTAYNEGAFLAKILDNDKAIISVGENKPQEQTDFKIFPNPTENVFTVSLTTFQLKNNLQIIVINVLGQVIYSESINSFTGSLKKEINLGNVSKGSYSVQLFSQDLMETKKIVIQ